MTGRFLSSRLVNYTTGSKQQLVYTNQWHPQKEDIWIVIPALHKHKNPDDTVPYGSQIRLKHKVTRRNLHSHSGHESPKSNQQEATCFGDDKNSDSNDNWIVRRHSYTGNYDDSGYWCVGDIISLFHVETGKALHSHDIKLDSDYNEVTCFGKGYEENDKWLVNFF
ncbi:hypothetical protein G9A89_012917 [Geosiphon pyriformis]|nr:hypothetical protein G9A89_012917 [Geosiphon pyriformis]